MKAATFAVAAASLVQLSLAQPAHIGNLAHRHKRDVVTIVDYVTASTTNVMVYVDQNGTPRTTSTIADSQPTGAAATSPTDAAVPAPAAPTSSAAVESASAAAVAPSSEAKAAQSAYTQSAVPLSSSAAAPAPYRQSAPASSAVPSSSQSAPTSGSSGSSSASGASGLGINYSPYHGDHTCKSADQVMEDFKQLEGYSIVRSYGTDCIQVPNMINAARSKNMQIMLGIYQPTDAAKEAKLIVDGVKATGGDWSIVHSVSVGNEAVNSGQASVGVVLGAMETARGTLKQGGYSGPVVTVDTFDTLINHPELCHASDFAAANAHAFFDDQTSAEQAGTWARTTVQRVKQACGKDVTITESGWPTQGSANGAAVPSQQNQQTAISSLKSAFPSGGLFLFSAFNDLWKTDFTGSFGCEKYWGIYGTSSN